MRHPTHPPATAAAATASAPGLRTAWPAGCLLLAGLSAAAALQAQPADSDRDGVPDGADNCVLVPNPDQRDTNANGIGNACDADLNGDGQVNFADLALMKQRHLSRRGDPRFSPHADFDGDGLINFRDLAVLRSSLFRRPGPAGANVAGNPQQGLLALNLTATAQPVCGAPTTHAALLTWQVQGSRGALQIEISGLTANGSTPVLQASSTNGSLTVPLRAPGGGPANLRVLARDASGARGQAHTTVLLAPCVVDPPPVPPGLAFQPEPVVPPPVLGAPNGIPREVDLVHLGGSPGGTPAKLVVAAGTGAGFRLTSWGLDGGSLLPVPLQQTEPLAGRDIKLLTLAPVLSPKLAVAPFVSAVRRDDNNLWLSSWQVFNDGSFARLGSRGFGVNANVLVQAHALAYRVLPNGNFQVVSVLRHAPGPTFPPSGLGYPRLRTISWEIDRATGAVNGRADSGNWGLPHAEAQPSISHLRDGIYTVQYRDENGHLANHYWQADANGALTNRQGAVSGVDHAGSGSKVQNVDAAIGLPLVGLGYMAPVIGTQSQALFMGAWETRPLGAFLQPHFISDNSLDERPDQHGVARPLPVLSDATDSGVLLQPVRARLTDGRLAASFGLDNGRLFEQLPLADLPLLPRVQMASVTKNMVLLLAVEAIEAGQASLDDVVQVTATAAGTPGSQMGMVDGDADDLQPDERQTLRTLLHGMMLRSGNDAAAAIAEHLQGAGQFAGFVARMNLRASHPVHGLGMTQTLYGETDPPEGAPAGGGISTPADQTRLWLFAHQKPLFAQIANARTYAGCGTTALGAVRCYDLIKSPDSGYAGLGGWKGGNGGIWIRNSFDPYHIGADGLWGTADDGPFCRGSGCLVAQARRLDRDMVVAVQNSGNRWAAADALFRYGYERQFSADRRGPEVPAIASVLDFGMDHVHDTLGVTVDLTNEGGSYRLCSWQLSADVGQISTLGCRTQALRGVPGGGPDTSVPTRVDGSRISTLLADGDYWTGHTRDGWLWMNLWRVGPKQR